MERIDVEVGQKVTVFRQSKYEECISVNEMIGEVGTIVEIFDNRAVDVQFDDGVTYWTPIDMLEITPTLDQIKIGTRIQVNGDECFPYKFATGVITSFSDSSDGAVNMWPDDPVLQKNYPDGICLFGNHRFRILDQPPKDVTKNFSRVSVYVEVWPRDSDGISHKLEFKWCDGMKSSTLRDQINRFIDKMEKM
jgi:hypothetical protein